MFSIKIDPYDGHELAVAWDELYQASIDRASTIVSDFSAFLSRMSDEKAKLNPYYHLLPSEEAASFRSRFMNRFFDFQFYIETLHSGLSSKFCLCSQ